MSKTSSRASSQETDINNSSSGLSSPYTPAANNCSYAQLKPTSEYSRVAHKSPGINYKQHQVSKEISIKGIRFQQCIVIPDIHACISNLYFQSGFPPPYGSNRPKRAYSSVFLKAQRFERSMDKIPNEVEQTNTANDSSDSRYKNS